MKLALASSPSGAARSQVTRPIRLMIVDDSMVARAVLSRMVEADGDFEIAAVAGTGEDAVTALRHIVVDIVLLDLEMPGLGGLKSIPAIIEAARGARIMIVSSLAEEGAEETVTALALGAADTLPKPGTGRFNGRFSEILVARLRALGHADRFIPDIAPGSVRSQPGGPALRSMASDPIELLAIGASTGGIHALGNFFAALPARIGVPILVTQHLPPAFMTVFARQLGTAAGRPAVVAQDGIALTADTVFVAPGDAHMTVVAGADGGLVVRLTHAAASSGCLPSVDPMFASIGALLGRKALGVVLTGMGRDGYEGAAKLVACGGSVLAQDEASSAVWGMPRCIADGGLAAAILPPDKLARRVASRCSER